MLSKSELSFLKKHELCRLATASKEGMPHVTPVVYAMNGGDFVIVIDYGEKKLKNLIENPKLAFVVDDFRPNKGVMIQGKCEVVERGVNI